MTQTNDNPKTEHLGNYDGQAVKIMQREAFSGPYTRVELFTTDQRHLDEFELAVTIPIVTKATTAYSTVYKLLPGPGLGLISVPCKAKIHINSRD